MLAAILVAVSSFGCARPSMEEIGEQGGRRGNVEELGARLETVAVADQLVLDARRAVRPGQARELLERAADLRARLFRRERKTVDALEAIELWGAVAKLPGARCTGELESALLDGELRQKPATTYERLQALKLREADAACQARIDRALLALVAYRSPTSAPAVAEEPARIERVERYGALDAARIVIFVSRPVRFESARSVGPSGKPRVFVDIDGASYAGSSSYDVGGLVERVSLGAREGGTRVVLDLKASVEPSVFYLPEPFRLVIDVLAEQRAKEHTPRAVRRVVLDPGHGGHDPGATGPNGLREKDVALDIAHRAAPLLAHELGITTLLTRDGDQFVPLDERSARANAFHADLFVSIHCNASDDGLANGVTTFVLDRGREDVALRAAARENSSSEGAATELADALVKTADPVLAAGSLRLADLLQRAARASLEKDYQDIPDGGVQRAGFYVLAGARMPAVLFEASFISNVRGAAHLNSGDFRQKMADAVVNAVRAYRDGL